MNLEYLVYRLPKKSNRDQRKTRMQQDFEPQTGTWKWGLLCLVFLAPFFFLSYGFANQYADNLPYVGSIVFDWEHKIPLWPWTIVPYWSIDLFYGLSLLLCWNRLELKQHALRLFTAQLIAVSCFLLFPLKFSFDRPALDGFFGVWFDVLMGFDKPFNQAPSLHIVLLVILWDFYRRHVVAPYKWIVDLWSFLIGLSVLTTWQHHFIDIPTGVLAGALCIWLFPFHVKAPYQADALQYRTSRHIRLASYYLVGALGLSFIAFYYASWTLWLLYPAVSLTIVGLAYLLVRPHFFQKQANGRLTHAATLLLGPYLVMAWLNSRLWTKKHPEDSKILTYQSGNLYLGRIPTSSVAKNYTALFDCCAELPVHTEKHYQAYFSLDLIPLQPKQLKYAVRIFDDLVQKSKAAERPYELLVFCALGYSRSTAILCAWLIDQNFARDPEDALRIVQTERPWVRLNIEQMQCLHDYAQKLEF